MSTRLISWEFAKKSLRLSDEQKELVTTLIGAVSSLAERLAGRSDLDKAERTDLVDGTGSYVLLLPAAPIISISSIRYSAARAFDDAVELDVSRLKLYERMGMVESLDSPFARGRNVYQVVYTAGYETDAYPAEAMAAAIHYISSNLTKLNDHAYGYRSVNQSDGTNITYDFDLTLLDRQALESLALPEAH